ncbi:hypothetical protein HYX14_01725 [Candidatus Woesearchaeota archaeon]|nr:hypothetical protein [Candidatus Woesearchaeota archaeon]
MKQNNVCGSGRRAQMEMIGLVIIVILITLGMLFLFTFAFKEAKTKKIFTRQGLAKSTVSSLLKTTVNEPDCVVEYTGAVYPQIGKDLLDDCAANYYTKDDVNGFSRYKCGGKHSCVYLKDKIGELLEATLGTWNKKYEFRSSLITTIETEPVMLVEITGSLGGCPGKKERDSSGSFPLNTEAGNAESVLMLCD